MDATAVIAMIGGVALLIGIFGGGLRAKEVEIPLIPTFVRILSTITGIVLLGIAIWLSTRSTASAEAPATSNVISTNSPQLVITPSVTVFPTQLETIPSATISPTQNVSPTKDITLSFPKLSSSDYGELLYEDNFNNDTGVWTFYLGGRIQEGVLVLPPSAFTAPNWNAEYSDFIYETEFQFLDPSKTEWSGMSVYLRHRSCSGNPSGCSDQVGVSSKGEVMAWNHTPSTKQILAPTLASEFIVNGSNTLTIIVDGNEFKIFINAVFVRSFIDSSFDSGGFTMDVDGTSIAFDYVRIYALP